MATGTVERERRRISVRAPITGLILVGIVVFGTYYGWQSAFGGEDTISANDGCATPTSTTPATTTPGATTPATSAPTVAPAVALTTSPPVTTTPPPSADVLLPGDVTVNVYNATLRQGLANNTAALLRERGFTVKAVGNDPLEAVIPEAAQIRAARADMPEVRLLVQHIPGAVVLADGRTDSSIDVVLGEAFTVLGDPATVTPVPLATPRC